MEQEDDSKSRRKAQTSSSRHDKQESVPKRSSSTTTSISDTGAVNGDPGPSTIKKQKRKKKKKQAPSGQQTPINLNVEAEEAGFNNQGDFIAFDFEPNFEFEEGNNGLNLSENRKEAKEANGEAKAAEREAVDSDKTRRRDSKGKGRETSPLRREREREHNSSKKRERSRSRSRSRDRKGRDKDRERDRRRDKDSRRDRDRRDHDRDRDRHHDRRDDYDRRHDGGRNDKKRKYDLIHDFDEYEPRSNGAGYFVDKKSPWVDALDSEHYDNVAQLFNAEVAAFTKWISPTPEEDELRHITVSLIAKAVTKAFPDAEVRPFGSYETKLYLPQGDIDVVVVSRSMNGLPKDRVLSAVAAAIKSAGIALTISIIAKAKVPLVKFTTIQGRLKVDMCINQTNGLAGVQIINGFLTNMKSKLALRSLVLILKSFLGQRSMNEVFTGGIGSYAIVCLVVSFLQMHPKIRNGEIDPDKNLGVLALEMFELYGLYFNFEHVGISVRDGGSYYDKHQRGWYNPSRMSLSIEDPADQSNDISAGSYNFKNVRATLAGAHHILLSNTFIKAQMLRARSGHGHIRFSDNPRDLSILSSILGVTQETINHRRVLKELYKDQTLHKLLGVKPQPLTVVADTSDMAVKGSRSQAAQSVKDAWKGKDDVSDEDHVVTFESGSDDSEEEGEDRSRRQHPTRKRQRTDSTKIIPHTVPLNKSDFDSDSEEGAYISTEEVSAAEKRSYWLSKGHGHVV